MLEVSNIDVSYGDMQALWKVSLEVKAGEIVALLGANGAGKSTTLKTVMGLLHPSAGDILLGGQSIRHWAPHRITEAGLSLVPEGRGLFTTLTVAENLEVGAHLPRTHADKAKNLAWIYEIFPVLKEKRKALAGSLSGGQQQMLAIARALMSRPQLLILDEPSQGVAPVTVRRIMEVLAELNRQGVTVLIVEQSVGLALQMCHRAYVLESGQVVVSGPPSQLREDAHIRAAYLGTA